MKSNGGRAALGGFLFQFVATFGFVADAAIPAEAHAPGDDEGSAVLRAVRTTGLTSELYDADAVALGLEVGDETVVIQVKYSGADSPSPIYNGELKAISDSLAAQITRIAANGGRATDRVLLVTNRELAATAKKLNLQAAAGRKKPKKWSAEAWKALARLRIGPRTGLHGWTRSVHRFGGLLGATEHEIHKGLEKLIGALLLATGQGQEFSVTTRLLAEAITDSPEARPLDPDRVAEVPLAQVHKFFERAALLQEEPTLVRRDLLEQISRVAEESALILLEGYGGGGKTVAAAQWLQERAERGATHGEAFGGISRADVVRKDWPRSVFRHWVGVENGPDTWPPKPAPVNGIVTRCAIARHAFSSKFGDGSVSLNDVLQNEGPFFALVVDGLDEASSADTFELREVVEWFADEHRSMRTRPGERPRAIMLLTCRTERELMKWYDPGGSASLTRDHLPYTCLRTDGFSRGELLAAAEMFDPDVARRLRATIELEASATRPRMHDRRGRAFGEIASGATADRNLLSAGLLEERAAVPIAANVIDALRHPAMWKVFKQLSLGDRDAVLDGDGDGLIVLAERFLRWALHKCMLRMDHQASEAFNVVRHLIKTGELALEAALKQEPLRQELWDAGYDRAFYHKRSGDALGRELELSGVVDFAENDVWSWRHGFVGQFFSSAEAKQRLRDWALKI